MSLWQRFRNLIVEAWHRGKEPIDARRCACGQFWVRYRYNAFVEAERGTVRMLHSPRRCFDFNALPVIGPEARA